MSSSQEKDYEVKRLDENNIADLEKLYTSVYKKNPSTSYFRKKYDTAFTGVLYVGYLAYKKDIPIAFYGVIPCSIQHENEKILAAQSADTMTHPEHRYKSLFLELSATCFELCKQKGIKLLFGFPNQNSYHGALKLGWQLTEIMDCFIIKVKPSPLQKLLARLYKRRKKSFLKKYCVNEIGLENSVIKDGFSGVLRDKNYLQFKTYSPTSVLQISNSKVWISTKNSLRIGDIDVNENDYNNMIEMIKKLSKKLAINTIYFHACKQTSLHNLFSNKFESIQSFPVLFQNFDNQIDIHKIKFTFADIDIF